MLHLTSKQHRRRGPMVPECSRLLFGLALLFTLFSDGAVNRQFTALSTVITANTDPSALQQLATFAAMEDDAEEEELDWGSSGRLVRKAESTLVRPRNAVPPVTENLSAASSSSATAHTHARTVFDGLSKSLSDTASQSALTSSGTSTSTASSSRRRPHRRHHGRSSLTSAAVEEVLAVSQPVHSYAMWAQFHVIEVAYSTDSNNFIHLTERFLRYQQMFPEVYRCDLSKVECPHEAALLAAPSTGLAASSHWSCASCGRKHDVVRESCLRCHTPGPYAKLFFGQALKEVDCAESLIRFLYAAHPEIAVHRVDGHHDISRSGVDRGRGCASVYVRREDAPTLQSKLNHNAYFDVEESTGDVVVHYVYTEQQEWLRAFVQLRNSQLEQRPLMLPLAPLVVEESAVASSGTHRHSRPGRSDRSGMVATQ